MNPEEQGRKLSQLIAKCWADEGFKQKLLADPAATLKAEGVELPAGLSFKALEIPTRCFIWSFQPSRHEKAVSCRTRIWRRWRAGAGGAGSGSRRIRPLRPQPHPQLGG